MEDLIAAFKGEKGDPGANGKDGKDGRGLSKIEKTATKGADLSYFYLKEYKEIRAKKKRKGESN